MTTLDVTALALRGTAVTPAGLVADALVVADRGTLLYVGSAATPGASDALRSVGLEPPTPDDETLLVPGFVDVHNHGGGGIGFPEARTLADVAQAVRTHLSHGTTSVIASLVTTPAEALLAQAGLLGEAAEAGLIAGIHCEGPFLSPQQAGAQSPADLVAGDAGFVRELAAAAKGHLRTMTVAPEVPGVMEQVAPALLEAGVIPSLGHTDATYQQTWDFVQRFAPVAREQGRSLTVTHLFNGMPPLLHRAPGPVAAALQGALDGLVYLELVADGVHLDPATMRLVEQIAPGAVIWVTDAMAATGMPDGTYDLGPMRVKVVDGTARLVTSNGAEPGAIAGGTSTLAAQWQSNVEQGVDAMQAALATAAHPARALGLDDVGGLAKGRRADVAVLDQSGRVKNVYQAGSLVA